MKKQSIEEYLEQNLSRSTADRYGRIIRHFIATTTNAKKCHYKDVVAYMDRQNKKYPSTGTSNTILSAIKKYFNK